MAFTRFFTRSRWDDERRRELDAYLAIETDENVARGMAPDAARDAARRKLGNATLVREEIYQMNTLTLVDAIWRDFRFGARLLRRTPGFAVVAVLSLALGIGANAAIFQLLDAVEFRALPVHAPGELVEIRPSVEARWGNVTGRVGRSVVTFAMWQQLRSQEPFSSVMAWGTNKFDLATSGESRLVDGLWVSGDFFGMLGVPPALGRVFTAQDDVEGCGAPGVVVSDAFWRREYGGDPSVIGRTVQIDGHPFEVIGVTPPGFFGVEVGRSFDVAVPICAEPTLEPSDDAVHKRHYWWLDVMARLKPGWTIDRATAQLRAASPGLFAATVSPLFPQRSAQKFLAGTFTVFPAGTGVSYLRSQYERPLWVLLAIAGLVLGIACANLANLMLARATAREREIAVRLAIGASRRQVVRQLLAESLLLAACGAAAGAVLAQLFSRLVVALISTRGAALAFDLRSDWRVLLFTCALAAGACLLFGLMPAMRSTRQSTAASLKTGGRSSESRERFGLRRALVVAQVAFSLVLVVGALLFVRTAQNLAAVDPGLRTRDVLAADFDVRSLRVPPARQVAFERELRARLAGISGVEGAVDVSIEPLSGSGWNDRAIVNGVALEATPYENRVSPGFFALLGIPFVAGRDFDDRDVAGAPMVAVVNELFADRILGTRDALGRTFRLQVPPGEPDPTYEVVGIVRNTKYSDVRDEWRPLAYYPEAQEIHPDPSLANVEVLLRGRMPIAQLRAAVTAAAREVAPGAVVQYRTLEDNVRASFQRERMMAILSGFFGALAAAIAMIGLYGVMSYSVARRRNEIGVRMALGAGGPQVRRLIMREAVTLLLAGLVAGAVLSVAAARSAATLLYGLTPTDPATLASAVVLLAAVAALAGYLPAWRASRLNPTIALHDE